MLTAFVGILILAAMYGFTLGWYFVHTRTEIRGPMRWLAGGIGGMALASVMTVIVLMLLWPPFNFILTIIGLGIIAAISVGLMKIGKKTAEISIAKAVVNDDRGQNQNGGDLKNGMDAYSFDFDISAGP